MPTDYRHTDNNLGLVMLLMALYRTRQSQAPNINRCAPENWPWPLTLTRDLGSWAWPRHLTLTLTLKQGNSDIKTRFLAFDLWPMTLPYNLNLAKVKVNLHTEYQGHRSNGSAMRVSTDRQTDGRYQIHYLPRFAVDKNLYLMRDLLTDRHVDGRTNIYPAILR